MLAALGCSGGAPVVMRGKLMGDGDAGTKQPSSPSTNAQPDNPQSQLLMRIDAGAYSEGRSDVPFRCVPGVFCKIQERDQENCGTYTLTLDMEAKPGSLDLLLVFDQSRSMAEAWGSSGRTKVEAAQNAIATAVASQSEIQHVGAIFFPTYPCGQGIAERRGGVVAPIEGTGQIPLQPSMQFLQAWSQHWSQGSAQLVNGTPLQEAFDRADQAIQNMTLKQPLVVLLVTDGEPNCSADSTLTLAPTAPATERATAWLMDKGIQTYVVGLPGAAGTQLLNDIASSGGTSQYILPDDPSVLEAKLEQLVRATVVTHAQTCDITLVPPGVPANLLKLDAVEVGGVRHTDLPHVISPTSGWSATSDGSHVQLTGDLCQETMQGMFSAITVEYGCPFTPPEKPSRPQPK